MNREIKFRAWGDNRMYSFDLKDLYSEGCENSLDYSKYLALNTQMPYEGMNIMQYTGLTDDNDKEIFEGDVIQFGAQLGSKSEVKYITKNAGFLVKDKWGDWQWLYDVVASTNCEVIGNIYEHPHLLS